MLFFEFEKLNKYKHIVWDWNGTLFDDVLLCMDIMNNILKRRDLKSLTLEEYRDVFTFPVKKYYQKIGHDLSNDNFEKLSIEFISEYENRKYDCKLYPDASNVLDYINNLGISQSILSAYSQQTLEEIINHFAIQKYFIGLIGLDNIYAGGKMENGKRWMEQLGHKKEEVLLIGDTEHDFEVAQELSIDCILITGGHQSKERLLKTKGLVFDSLTDFLNSSSLQ